MSPSHVSLQNQMLWDLGMPGTEMVSTDLVDQKIQVGWGMMVIMVSSTS